MTIKTSDVPAKAQRKVPGYKEGQQEYTKQYRINVHQWSYGRLIESMQQAASKVGIAIESSKQLVQGRTG